MDILFYDHMFEDERKLFDIDIPIGCLDMGYSISNFNFQVYIMRQPQLEEDYFDNASAFNTFVNDQFDNHKVFITPITIVPMDMSLLIYYTRSTV